MAKIIVIIDDEKDFTELTSTLLKFHDFDVDTYNNPLDLRPALEKKHYDLIVTDLMMPHMDGFELIRFLRGGSKYKDIPIIVLSAKTLNDEERKFLFQNHTIFIMKPFEPHALVEQIRQQLGT